MKSFIRSLCDLGGKGECIVVATVVESSGSTPRSSGAKMLVRADGAIVGTVGGGLAEAMACRKACHMLESGVPDGASYLMFVDMTQELAADSDMICGGGLSILLECIHPEGAGARAYAEVNELLRRGRRCVLATSFEESDGLTSTKHAVREDDECDGPLCFSRDADRMTLREAMTPPAPLYIFGAGHVSQFTARVAAMVGFRTVVLDDREDFANRVRFPEADEIIVLQSFDGCCERLGIGEDAFLVIVTRGHLHDRTVLAEALRTPARYVGMIGSSSKRDKIYQSLLEDGFTQSDLDRCHCPIGLSIGGRTPEEIAVSIGAELIQVRAGQMA